MEVFFSAIRGILKILFIFSLGYVLSKKGWFDEKTSEVFTKLVINVSFPLNMIVNITSNFSKEDLLQFSKGLLVPFFSILLSYFIGKFLGEIFKIKKERKGLFTSCFSLSNSIFVGLPMSQALFGEIATPYTLLYYMANTTIWWTLGVYGIVKDSERKVNGGFSLDTIKRIFNPPFLGFITGVLIIFLNLCIPQFIFDSFKIVGDLTTPLSLFYVSTVIYEMGFSKFKINKEAILVFLGRFLISPLLVFSMTYFISIPKIMRDVFIVMSAMPVLVSTAIVSKFYGGDYEFAVTMITYTTIISIFVMPFLMVILKAF